MEETRTRWINGTWRRSLLDVRVRRGADVGSDHHLVTAVLKLKLRRAGKKITGQQHFAVDKLHDPKVKAAFILQLKNRFQALADMSDNTQKGPDDANIKWEQIKNAYSNSSEVCLGIKQRNRKEWITADTWKVIADRRALKKK